MHAVGEIARRYGLKLHVDGARIFNAAIALGVKARDLVAEAEGLVDVYGISLDPKIVRTHIVYFDVTGSGTTSQVLAERLSKNGGQLLPIGSHQMRAVTSYQITSDDIECALGVFHKVL